MPAQFETFRTIIESHTQIVLTTHVNPDGDGLGTEVALAAYLQKLGKQATILNCSATPENYLFLTQLYPILHFDPSRHTPLIEQAEVIIVLDTNHLDRLDTMKPALAASKAVKICIDHHLEPGEFAALYIIDEASTATGEIIYRLLSYLTGRSIDRETAIGLYTAIMTDTGSFRFPKTDPETHKIIAQLIQMGADPSAIYDHVYERGSINRLHLLGLALSNMKTAHEGKIAYIVLTREMFEQTITTEVDADAFAPYTLTIGGVQIGLLFSEMNGIVKVSFRSKGDIWINELAKEFGGNGHKNAAGARISSGSLNDIISQVLEHAGSYIL
ncbi:MAG: bifunctional oligoribonuclease/PAP phosphatase NrnA [Ignavibacteriae bacterium]|nr:MAG: bifunctional oligoribonuclease/PAP phosphatase NrnA [Ignavibacteriota bacterium]